MTTAGANLVQVTSASSSTGALTLSATPWAGNPRAKAVPATLDGETVAVLVEHSSIQDEWELNVEAVYTHGTLNLTRPASGVDDGSAGPGANTDFSPGGLIVSIVQVDEDTIRFKRGVPVTTSRAIANTDNGKRIRWRGTSAGRFDVPSGLNLLKCEVVIDHDLAGIAPLTIERTIGDGNVLLGDGGGILRPSGIATIRVVEDGIYINGGPFDQPAISAQNGGASFLLERGSIVESAGVAVVWTDSYGLNDFSLSGGSPAVGDGGELTWNSTDSPEDMSASVTYAGTSLLVGCSNILTEQTGATVIPFFNASDFGAGRGLGFQRNSAGGVQFFVVTDAATFSSITITPGLNVRFSLAAAINRAAGYVHVFSDEGVRGRMVHRILSGLTFVVDWTAAGVTATIGGGAGPGASLQGRSFAVNVRDNVTFANETAAIEQARALFHEMISYYD